jgi:hypothetical protein
LESNFVAFGLGLSVIFFEQKRVSGLVDQIKEQFIVCCANADLVSA